MKEKKYLALDIGNVICNVDEKSFLKTLSEMCNISLNEANMFFLKFWELHDIGFTTLKNELYHGLNIRSEFILDKLENEWSKLMIQNTVMVSAVNRLIDNFDVNVALLSNIGKEHVKLMPHLIGSLYDKTIHHFSCEVGARKPSFLFYQSFLMRYPEFECCLFIDDRLENVEAANKMDFDAHQFSLAEPSDIGYDTKFIDIISRGCNIDPYDFFSNFK